MYSVIGGKSRARPIILLNTFERLTSSIYLYDIPQGQTSSHSHDNATSTTGPRLIILCSWMSAAPVHISKYLGEYQARYPGSAILVITSSPSQMVYRTYRSQERSMAPAVDAITRICNALEKTARTPVILLHLMSNGGANNAVNLLAAYSKLQPDSHFPSYVTIFDSVPGIATFSPLARALRQSFTPRDATRMTRQFVATFVYLLVTFYWLFVKLWRQQNLISLLRAKLNDCDGLMGAEVRRGYVYSEADDMVPWQVVEDHISAAIERKPRRGITRGINVAATEKFSDSRHCAHMRADGGQKYWNFVERLWRASPSL